MVRERAREKAGPVHRSVIGAGFVHEKLHHCGLALIAGMNEGRTAKLVTDLQLVASSLPTPGWFPLCGGEMYQSACCCR
jgi:hypothetical protein